MTLLVEAYCGKSSSSHTFKSSRRLPNSLAEQAAVQVSKQIICSEQARVVLLQPQDSEQNMAHDAGHDLCPRYRGQPFLLLSVSVYRTTKALCNTVLAPAHARDSTEGVVVVFGSHLRHISHRRRSPLGSSEETCTHKGVPARVAKRLQMGGVLRSAR